MLTHHQIWTALDRLAEHAGLSPSGLAKRAGLDPTTFNKSKRVTNDGRERWPSTESVAKALAATNTAIDAFVQMIEDTARGTPSVPLLGFAEAGAGGYFDDGGFPVGKGWDEVGLPAVNDKHAYDGLQLTSKQFKRMIERQFDVLYREGAESGRVMAIALHPYLSGHPHNIDHLDAALEHICKHDEVWLATGGEIAEAFARTNAGG